MNKIQSPHSSLHNLHHVTLDYFYLYNLYLISLCFNYSDLFTTDLICSNWASVSPCQGLSLWLKCSSFRSIHTQQCFLTSLRTLLKITSWERSFFSLHFLKWCPPLCSIAVSFPWHLITYLKIIIYWNHFIDMIDIEKAVHIKYIQLDKFWSKCKPKKQSLESIL